MIWNTTDALTVPSFAITRQTGQAFVFVVANNPNGATTVSRRPVTLGALTGDRWTVTEGLKPGERVAVTRVQGLRDGQPVSVQERKAAATQDGAAARRDREL